MQYNYCKSKITYQHLNKWSKNCTNKIDVPEPKNLVTDFLDNFIPEKSLRECRKFQRNQINPTKIKTVFDENGKYRINGADFCDCLDNACPGCHFPCLQCNSPKCGATCRSNRKWAYTSIENDGKDLVIKAQLHHYIIILNLAKRNLNISST